MSVYYYKVSLKTVTDTTVKSGGSLSVTRGFLPCSIGSTSTLLKTAAAAIEVAVAASRAIAFIDFLH